MNADRIAAGVAGVLYFLGLIAGVLSVVPVIDQPDYLVQISAHVGQVTVGALCQFLMMAAYVGMAITLYPNEFPLALQEIVFAVWLLAKGFNASIPH